MRVDRQFTTAGKGPYDGIEFRKATSEIRNPDGSIVFQLKDIEVPAAWSQVASDILAQKYFRKAGVPARLKKVEENSVPSWLWRSVEDTEALAELPEEERYSSEMSAQQVFNRLAGTWTYWGWKGGYFDAEEDALAFYEELVHMLATQRCAPNSPQWFNTGLHWAYGIDGPGQGHHYVDFETGKLVKSKSAYEHPQPHACFIQSISDDLVNEGGIMDLWVREARLFKYGSGTGSNFSFIRGENEPLSGGGKSSGLMSLPEDRRPRSRRHQVRRHHAARGQDGRGRHRPSRHRGLYRLEGEGRRKGRSTCHRLEDGQAAPQGHHEGLRELRRPGQGLLRPGQEPGAEARHQGRRKAHVPDAYIKRVLQFASQGFTEIEFDTYDTDWDGEAYRTVSGQNSNNSVRVTDEFLRAVENGSSWDLNWRMRQGRCQDG
jgi:ribonucleoside-diphosphate reductase alpha chain